jgi:site-specific DNA recombinase
MLAKNTHEPLITQEQWDIVQDVLRHKKHTFKYMDEPNMFSGLVFCADCGKTQVLYRARKSNPSNTVKAAGSSAAV